MIFTSYCFKLYQTKPNAIFYQMLRRMLFQLLSIRKYDLFGFGKCDSIHLVANVFSFCVNHSKMLEIFKNARNFQIFLSFLKVSSIFEKFKQKLKTFATRALSIWSLKLFKNARNLSIFISTKYNA